MSTTESISEDEQNAPDRISKGVAITVGNQIFLQKSELNPQIIKFLREELNFFNTEYLIKQKIGKSVYGVEKYFKLISEENDKVLIPRGFVKNLTDFCYENSIKYQVFDKRKSFPFTKYKSKIELFDYQLNAVKESEKHDYGVIVAPPGAGKTIIGLELIVRKAQPTLILVHRKQLLDQWVERIQSFLKINKKEIGQISGSKKKVGKQITVAMVQSLVRQSDLSELKDKFGTIIVDECHHIPAKSFRDVIVGLNSFYLYGLTATPKRKYNDEKLIFYYIGEIICELGNEYKKSKNITDPILSIKETTLKFPYDNGTDDYQLLSKVLVFDTNRNVQITSDIIEQVRNKRKILVLTDRKDHVEVLNQYLKKECETITLTGDDSNASKKSKLEQINQGHFQVLLATGQLFGEGIDISTLDCLFIVYPLSFEGKLEQYIGRIQRSSGKQYVFDYRDVNIPYFEKMFKKRNKFYKKAFIG
jgi:superfamily II DNA or RNA helicase